MPPEPLADTYAECRRRFRHAATASAVDLESFPLSATGPGHEELTIDVAQLGSPDAGRAFVVMSGVHGVEGYLPSTLQCELLDEHTIRAVPNGVTVLLIHIVNPWGMAWGRRQNESNVDLNRNWRRSETAPPPNDAYDALHPLACPDSPTLPEPATLLAEAADLLDRFGFAYLRDGITQGQYRHPDGLHYGGARTEESNAILERVIVERLRGAAHVFTMDLHTGHGPRAEVTLLSDAPPDSDQDRFLREQLGAPRVEATEGNPESTAATKTGKITNGFRDALPAAECFAAAVEFGTEPDEVQLIATCREQWVYRRGDRGDVAHAEAVREYGRCFTPEDPTWAASCLTSGRAHLRAGLDAVARWSA